MSQWSTPRSRWNAARARPAADEEWVDALLIVESARGPLHGDEPSVSYATLWALWLSAVPYGLWSEQVSTPSIEEQLQMLDGLAEALQGALDHFGLGLRHGTTVADIASAIASLTEGVWLGGATDRPRAPEAPASVLAGLVLLAALTIAAGLASPVLVERVLLPAARGAL